MRKVSLPKLLLGTAFLYASALPAQNVPAPAIDVPQLTESTERLGTFTLGGRAFSVLTGSQTISPASNARFATTVSGLQILDANASAVYQETFPSSMADGRFLRTLMVSASILEGANGQALVLRFVEDPAASGTGESWQMFGLVNGKLTRYGAPLPLGQGGLAVNNVLTGVMLRGGISVVPLASTAEALEFRVWAGYFFLSVPVRVDWTKGKWSEAEQCFANQDGGFLPVGCNLRVTPIRGPVTEGAAVTLYPQPQEDAYAAMRVPLYANSDIEFPAARALAKWQNTGDRFTCTFDDLWLQVRIDGKEGWVHSTTDFGALGLHSTEPAQ